MLIFNDYDAFKQIYGPNPNLIKSSRYAAVSASHTPNLVTDNDQHRVNMKRKAHLNMWNNRSLKKAEPRLHALIATFLSIMMSGKDSAVDKDSWSKTFNLTELGTYFGYDTTISMATGENPDLMLHHEQRWLPSASVLVSWRALTVRNTAVYDIEQIAKFTETGLLPTQIASLEPRQTYSSTTV
jgi:hypothetical protein